MPQPQPYRITHEERGLREMISHEVVLQHDTMTVLEVSFLAHRLAYQEIDFGEVGVTAAVVGFLAARAIATETVAENVR